MKKLNMIMMEIDHILAMLSDGMYNDRMKTDRCYGLHALFQEKVKTAVALRFAIEQANYYSVQPVEHEHNNS